MSGKTMSGEEVIGVVENLAAIIDGDMEYSTEAADEAREPGLNEHQLAVVDRYAGEGRVDVDSSRIPTFADKLAAGAKIPWTFVLDNVEFVVKTSMGSGSAPSEWPWAEEGYWFRFYKYDNRANQIRITESNHK